MADHDALARAVRTVADFPKPGIQFKDITPLLADADRLAEAAEALAAPFRDAGIDKVIGIESRGFILGALVARALGAGFVPVRKAGKLPYSTHRAEYALEYGTDVVEMHVDALSADDRVLIHDDVIATGGTAAATHRLVEECGATAVGFSFLVELAFLGGRAHLPEGVRVEAVLSYD